MNRSGSTVVLMIIVMAASPALGGEGVMEINQACAVHTGCFAGDDAGYPVTIVTSGSYLLTGNLEVSEIDVSAITVAAEDVTIDLRAFEIRGPITGCPSGCSGGGTGDGIVIDPSTLPNDAQGTTIRNGTVRGFASGVAVSTSNMLVEGVRSLESAFVGLFAGPGSTVVNSHAVSNGVAGFVGIMRGFLCVRRYGSPTRPRWRF